MDYAFFILCLVSDGNAHGGAQPDNGASARPARVAQVAAAGAAARHTPCRSAHHPAAAPAARARLAALAGDAAPARRDTRYAVPRDTTRHHTTPGDTTQKIHTTRHN